MRVLGIDCGSRVTGYGIVDADGPRYHLVECGAIRVSSAEPLADRLLSIRAGLARVIEQHRPDVAAFENIFHAANVQSALKLGHVRGVSMLAAAEANLPVFEYSPLEVKSAVTGYGRAEKNQVEHMVRSLLKLTEPLDSYDASDALAVAICHVNHEAFRKATAGRG